MIEEKTMSIKSFMENINYHFNDANILISKDRNETSSNFGKTYINILTDKTDLEISFEDADCVIGDRKGRLMESVGR